MKLGYVLIYVNDLLKTIDFYEKAFGLKKKFVNPTNQYAEMENDGGMVLGFVQDDYVAKHCVPGFRKNTVGEISAGFEIVFVTENINASIEKAVKAGATLVSRPTQKPWGQMVAYVTDINGILVEICGSINPTN
jgi:predicted enzyme related to lactoylglutathione lyase